MLLLAQLPLEEVLWVVNKIMLRLSGTLLVLCALCATLLAGAHQVAQPIIDERQEQDTLKAYIQVLPEAQNLQPVLAKQDKIIKSILASHAGTQVNGYIYTVEPVGYGGPLTILVGIDQASHKITGIKILAQTETPGLGAKSTEPIFTTQFAGRKTADDLVVTKNGQQGIQAITAATVTSKAVVHGVNVPREHYQNNYNK